MGIRSNSDRSGMPSEVAWPHIPSTKHLPSLLLSQINKQIIQNKKHVCKLGFRNVVPWGHYKLAIIWKTLINCINYLKQLNDRDPKFIINIWMEAFELAGITLSLSSS
jgi:hypothetical protein